MILMEYDQDKTAVVNPFALLPVDSFPKLAISCFSKELIDHFVQTEQLEIITKLPGQNGDFLVYKTSYHGEDIAIYMSPVGAPACVALAEDMIVYGVEKLLLFGCAGVLDQTIEDYGIIVPTCAIKDEGTSYHYLPPTDEIDLNPVMIEKIESVLQDRQIPYTKGKVWTTDAIYRETKAKVMSRKQMGAIAVEMECSAMAAMTQFRGITFGQFLYAADNLDAEQWEARSLVHSELSKKEQLIYLALDMITK